MTNQYLEAGVALYTSSQIREIELNYANKFSSGTYPLMEEAGKSSYLELKINWPEAKQILVLTGKGNNGGDGFVLARFAIKERKRVTLCSFCPQESLKGDSLKAFQTLPKKGINFTSWTEIVSSGFSEFDVIVDALLGTGIQGEVREPFVEVIHKINQSNKPILSIDVPSGLNADTGNRVNCAVKSHVTATFVGHKRGIYTGYSANYRGMVKLFKLGIPQVCFPEDEINLVSHNWRSMRGKLTKRAATSHKGDFGHCHLIGGGDGMAGALILASTAAARSGSGLTSAWMQYDAMSLIARQPEIMAKNVCSNKAENLLMQLSNVNTLVIGPGLGQQEWGKDWMTQISKNQYLKNKNKVWDADALNWLAKNPDFDDARILTPHPGEAARLLSITTEQVNQDRFSASHTIAKQYGGVCVLKGAGTVISNASGNQVVCAVGNPGMASGGMGDLLSGIIGGLLAQGFSLLDAATLGVCIHGEAADRAAGKSRQYRGLLASDLIKYLPAILNPS